MGYDVRPLVTLEEKIKVLNTAVQKDYFLFFEHDRTIECCNLELSEKGVRQKEAMPLSAIL